MVADTRQNIVDSAIFIFNEDLSAALEKVAEHASVTRRTLHRYFKDRQELLTACQDEMQRCCGRAMAAALQQSESPLEQLELILHAAIDCGVKYAFLHKLHTAHDHHHAHKNKECQRYDETTGKIRALVEKLQRKNIISKRLTPEWILSFFPGVVSATIHSHTAGITNTADLKQFAWYSFSKGIGI